MSNKGYRQDLPPEGGYRDFNWERTYARKLFRPYVTIPILVGCTAYGVYQGWAFKRQRLTKKFEDVDLTNAMAPFITAERDRIWLARLRKNRELEDEIMKDVPGWKTGTWYGEPVYFTLGEKWWDPDQHEFFAHVSTKKRDDEVFWRHHTEYAGEKFYDKWIPASIKQFLW